MLELNRRRAQDEEGVLNFNTPDPWCDEPGIRSKYSGLIFDRNCRDRDAAQKVLGVGHRLVDLAIKQARNSATSVTIVSRKILKAPLIVFRIRDQVTAVTGAVRSVVVGCLASDDDTFQLLRDWELLQLLNRIQLDRNFRRSIGAGVEIDRDRIGETLDHALNALEEQLGGLDLPFKVPEPLLLALLWPGEFSKPEARENESEVGEQS